MFTDIKRFRPLYLMYPFITTVQGLNIHTTLLFTKGALGSYGSEFQILKFTILMRYTLPKLN